MNKYFNKYIYEIENLITNKDFLVITLSIYLGTQLKSFFQILVTDVIMPIILALLPDKIEDYTIKFKGNKISFEKLVESGLSLLICISFLFFYSLVKTFLKLRKK